MGSGKICASGLAFTTETKRSALAQLPRSGGLWWVHAVSVGEINVAIKVITALLAERPDAGIVLSTTTPTGYQLALNFSGRHRPNVCAVYSPLDLKPVIRHTLDDVAPTHVACSLRLRLGRTSSLKRVLRHLRVTRGARLSKRS